ncbi:uncharacterized protein MYCFIDRAFT_82612 [Pseudocercospora fijiensis CIRAD86]|uniref:Alpha/beta hydrolase fold-3 domain-containing protein n=1 Tax=Pseudocercospora fijiensis (strain CIRAD86) TaxID=383855 RepID=M3B8K9_PSEFD|nr:uncharacterized protein MYCFIDRAFT_82612 [Pseudocercospora fijiensis CIRAD86]EME85648.1 hypothetical protein MYCFIDRAFT_82612 [Pseudocercospora fijiensis CIRAD86]
MSSTPQPPYPLHESVRDKLDPEYVEFYNKHIINNQQVQYQPVEASRSSGILIPGAGPQLPVGDIKDLTFQRVESVGPDVQVRVFTPEGPKPSKGWPVCLWFHGGGWVLGNINTENVVCSHICSRVEAVVVFVDYRTAPEDPFPAQVNDCWETVQWILRSGKDVLQVDVSRFAVAGSSAGGNLAAVMSQRAVERGGPKFAAQVLVVPVMDNTASPETKASWKENEFTAALPAEKMMWYRVRYLPNEGDWSSAEASPLLWSGDWSRLPPSRVIVGELDVLRSEGEEFAAKTNKAGVSSECFVMSGMPHPFLAMDGVLTKGKEAITLVCEGLKKTLH